MGFIYHSSLQAKGRAHGLPPCTRAQYRCLTANGLLSLTCNSYIEIVHVSLESMKGNAIIQYYLLMTGPLAQVDTNGSYFKNVLNLRYQYNLSTVSH